MLLLLNRNSFASFAKSATKIVNDLPRAIENPSSEANIILMQGDSLTIPLPASTVRIEGEVRHPFSMTWREGKGLDYYLNSAGGLTKDAVRDAVTVVLPSGRTSSKSWWLFSGPSVEPGSVILVPSRLSTTTTTTTTSTTSTTTTTFPPITIP